jgi:hypothetical protein
MAVCSVTLGLLAGLWFWQIPVAGLLISLTGLSLGLFTLKTARMAVAGTIFSLLALSLALLNLGIELLLGPGMF